MTTIVSAAETLVAEDPALTVTEWVADNEGPARATKTARTVLAADVIARFRTQQEAELARVRQRRSGGAEA